MTDRIRIGAMLMKDGTQVPESLAVDTEPYLAGWSSITKSTSAQLDSALEKAGWTFFYMAGEIHTSGFGFNDQSRTDRAVAHIIDTVKRERCNCLEITQMRHRSLLGLRYTSVVAHARHIQKSRSFHHASDTPASVIGAVVQVWENEGGSPAEETRPQAYRWQPPDNARPRLRQ